MTSEVTILPPDNRQRSRAALDGLRNALQPMKAAPAPVPVMTPAETIAGGVAAAVDSIINKGYGSRSIIEAETAIEHVGADGSKTKAVMKLKYDGRGR